MSDLRPCPFCGKAPKLKRFEKVTKPGWNYKIACKNIQCEGAPYVGLVSAKTGEYMTREEVIDAWNGPNYGKLEYTRGAGLISKL